MKTTELVCAWSDLPSHNLHTQQLITIINNHQKKTLKMQIKIQVTSLASLAVCLFDMVRMGSENEGGAGKPSSLDDEFSLET